jgi:hypothetical protein
MQRSISFANSISFCLQDEPVVFTQEDFRELKAQPGKVDNLVHYVDLLHDKIEALEKRLQWLEEGILCMPGNAVYEHAKEHFESNQ